MPHVFMDGRMLREVAAELMEFVAVWQFAIDKEIRHLDKSAMFGKVGYVVAAVPKYTFVAVNIGNVTHARSGIPETVVEGNISRLAP
jgi:hypothetical protein